MTALVSYGYRHTAFNVPPALVAIADETHVGYVVDAMAENKEMDLRAQALNESMSEELSSPSEWLQVAVSNLGYLRFTEPVQVDDFDAGMAQAKTFLDVDTTGEQGT